MSPSALYDMERAGAMGRGDDAEDGARSSFGCDEAVNAGLWAEETPLGRSSDGEEGCFAVEVSPLARLPRVGCAVDEGFDWAWVDSREDAAAGWAVWCGEGSSGIAGVDDASLGGVC